MVRNENNLRFHLTFCKCRPSIPFRGRQYTTHKKKCNEEKLGEFRICLKELAILKAPFTNECLQEFYNNHRDCNSGKVTSPRAKSFFASVFANEYEKGRLERRQEMTIELEDEVEEEEGDSEEGDSEESEEEEDERGEEERAHQKEQELAVASITNEILAPSLGDDFNWDEVTDWIEKETAARSQKGKEQETPKPQQQIAIQQTEQVTTTNDQTELETLHQHALSTESSASHQHSSPTESLTSHQILIPAHSAQTQTIIQLKDRLSREQKLQQDFINQIENLKNKLNQANSRCQNLESMDEKRKLEEEALDRARNVLEMKMAEVERREKVVKEIDEKIKKEKKEMWRERSKMGMEKEEVKTEREKMKAEKEKMEVEREKVEAEKKKMHDEMKLREDDLKVKGRRLKALFQEMKEESMKQKENEETKSLIHIPIKSGLIDGDINIQPLQNKVQNCFNTEVCGHLKIKHNGALKLISWCNKTNSALVKNDFCGSDSSDEDMPPTKKARHQ